MSLKSFHIVFITVSTLLAVGFGGWCVRHRLLHEDSPFLGLGIASFAVGVALVVYGIWFLRKIRTPEEEQRKRRSKFRAVSALVPLLLLAGRDALACSVCYGEADGPMIDAARMGVYLLFGLVLAMQFSFAAFFITLWRRARKSRQKEAAQR